MGLGRRTDKTLTFGRCFPSTSITGITNWYNNARFQAWVRREFLLRAAEEQQAQRQQKGSFLGTLCDGPIILMPTGLFFKNDHTHDIWHIYIHIYPEPPWVASASLPAFQEVVDWFGLHDWNRKVCVRRLATHEHENDNKNISTMLTLLCIDDRWWLLLAGHGRPGGRAAGGALPEAGEGGKRHAKRTTCGRHVEPTVRRGYRPAFLSY